MIYKISFASSDGIRIDTHFGHAEKFYIAELDTEKEDYSITGERSASPPCRGGEHDVSGFAAVLSQLSDISAIVAQRAGPGAQRFIREQGMQVYQIPLTIEEALCLFLEDKTWEVDKWRSHTKS